MNSRIWIHFKDIEDKEHLEEFKDLCSTSVKKFSPNHDAVTEKEFFINNRSVTQKMFESVKCKLLQIINGDTTMHIITEM